MILIVTHDDELAAPQCLNLRRGRGRAKLWVCPPARHQQHYESYVVLLHLAVMHACGSLLFAMSGTFKYPLEREKR
jgi:hypothetical protein